MTLPIVAIVGRPNVGKSRLFNRLVSRSQALVDDSPGVTRDRHYGLSEWRGDSFLVVDTGGLIPGAEEPLNKKVWDQAFFAIREADVILCIFDGKEGNTPMDKALVEELRPIGKPILYVINKVDIDSHEKIIYDFASLRINSPIPLSAEHGRGVSDLLEALHPLMPKGKKETNHGEENTLRISIIGRPNVGKSTLINRLAGQERVVVHEEPGTTRDSIDVHMERNGREYIFIDTAGIKRKRQTLSRLDKFSVIAALKSIDQSQFVLFLLDSLSGITHHELHLLYLIRESQKGLLILVNKWDLMKTSPQKYIDDLKPQLKGLQRRPVLCISAKANLGCEKIWKEIDTIQEGMQKRFATAKLNQWLKEISLLHPLPIVRGREVKFYYGTQVGINPPHIVLFTNFLKGVPQSYRRFLTNQLETKMDIEGVPVKISVRQRKSNR